MSSRTSPWVSTARADEATTRTTASPTRATRAATGRTRAWSPDIVAPASPWSPIVGVTGVVVDEPSRPRTTCSIESKVHLSIESSHGSRTEAQERKS